MSNNDLVEPLENSQERNTNLVSNENVDINKDEGTDKKIRVKGDDLTPVTTISYSIGHFQNDICASCWFNFMSYYTVHILQIDKVTAGFVLLSGQIADALATPIVGILSDKFDTKIGRRTPWYIGGTILVIICFTLMFQSDYILPNDVSYGLKMMYFIINPSLFNVGWAAVQVSHMSLLPSISLCKKKQDKMTRLRTGFTFGSQLISLVLSLIFFAVIDDKILQYSLLSISCIALGIASSTIFLINCREVDLSKNIQTYYREIKASINKRMSQYSSEEESNNEEEKIDDSKIDWRFWIKKPDFYYFMAVYMLVRMAINVSSSMIPFYCKNVLKWNNEDGTTPIQISIFLIIIYTGSVFNSLFLEGFVLKFFHKKNHRIVLFTLAVTVITIGCLPLYFLTADTSIVAYFLAMFFGIGFSMGLSGASSLMNDVVGSKGHKGAFVYGAYSFADKISCGILLFFMIQYADSNAQVLTIFMAFFPPITAVFALLFVIITKKLNKQLIDKKNAEEGGKKKHYGTVLDNSILTFV
jgi:Na+/melibiose symporter-like transporter